MSLRSLWFRWTKKDTEEPAPAEAAAPPQHDDTTSAQASSPPAEGAPDRPKRRRGTRGGRGRKKAAQEAPAASRPEDGQAARPERKPAAERKPPAERKAGERGGRGASRRRTAPKRAPLPPAKRELLVSVDVTEQRVAVLEDGRVAEVYLERPERRSIAGNIYLGVVDNVLPGMEAAFVEIGLEKNGFLYVDEIVRPELEGKRHGKKIQDLIGRGEQLLVQAVKDPMKTKGARVTMEISLPGRFLVFVPEGEGVGVSRRLPDEERARLKDVIKRLDPPQGGVIVRTAAEGASAEDVERDLVFLQRLWKTIQARAKTAKAPELIYQEAELPLRVVRDLFTGDFERAVVDQERTHRRIVGYLKKTSPHMVERVSRYREKTPLFEASGVDAEIRSTLSRRVDLPSGGYLIFDYAEAFTVIDVNTGRFVGGRGKNSNSRLEDTITKNNLEAVKEVVRQLRLRDIGGIIVIDFIDMANPKNRQTVEEALRTELERDRTKTYVVEISPLGLVEMTRQNVTDGPREILTRKCPACGGDGVVLSEASAAVDAERRLRALAAGTRTRAFRVELHPRVLAALAGPGASRLVEIEEQLRRRFFLQPADDGHGLEHFAVLDRGTVEKLQPPAPVAEGQELRLELVEVGLHDPGAGVGKVDGFDVCVGGAAALVGKKVRVRIERVLDGTAYATALDAQPKGAEPITAESEAEKPTRQPRTRKAAAEVEAPPAAEPAEAEPEAEASAPEAAVAAEGAEGEDAVKPRKRTRRGSRGGRRRKKATAATGEAAAAEAETGEATADAETAGVAAAEAVVPAAAETGEAAGAAARTPRIHVPEVEFGRDGAEQAPGAPARGSRRRAASDAVPVDAGAADVPDETAAVAAGEEPEDAMEAGGAATADEAEATRPRKRTRRGTRGGRRRKKADAASPEAAGADEDAPADADAAPADGGSPLPAEAVSANGGDPTTPAEDESTERRDWDYVPMSDWGDEGFADRRPG